MREKRVTQFAQHWTVHGRHGMSERRATYLRETYESAAVAVRILDRRTKTTRSSLATAHWPYTSGMARMWSTS